MLAHAPFSLKRFPQHSTMPFWAMLYMPVGLAVLIIRLVLWFLLFVIAVCIPPLGRRDGLYHLFLLCLGIIVRKNGTATPGQTPHVLVYNHVSLIDALVVTSLKDTVIVAASPSANESSFNKYFFGAVTKPFNKSLLIIDSIRNLMKSTRDWKDNTPHTMLCVAPEGTIGDGKGLYVFEKFFFSLNVPVIPVALRVTPALPVNVHPLGASHALNVFWMLAMPYVVARIEVLPPLHSNPDEKPADFAERTRVTIAQHLGVQATEFTGADKKRWKAALKLFKAGKKAQPHLKKNPI